MTFELILVLIFFFFNVIDDSKNQACNITKCGVVLNCQML